MKRRRTTSKRVTTIEPQQVNAKVLKTMARVCPNYETRFNLQVIQLKGKDAIVTDGCLAARIQVLTEPVEETLLAASNFKPRAQQWEFGTDGIKPKALEVVKGSFPSLDSIEAGIQGKPQTKAIINIELLEKSLAILKAAGAHAVEISIVPKQSEDAPETTTEVVTIKPRSKRRNIFDQEIIATDCVFIMPMRF